jgi:hypothetical protein
MNALTTEALVKAAPSVGQVHPHRGCSDKYVPISTLDIVDRLQPLGWRPYRVTEARCISPDRIGYQKHVVSLRHRDHINAKSQFRFKPSDHRIEEENGQNFFEMNITNSMDRSSTIQMFVGIFRQICANGLVVSRGIFTGMRERHINIDPDAIVRNIVKSGEQFGVVMENVNRMQAIELKEQERLDFGEFALMAKYETMQRSPIGPEKVLEPRRSEDGGKSLWKTFNVIQENIIRGGQIEIMRLDQTGRGYSPSQGITSLDRQIKINEVLWDRAAALLAAKQ